MFGKSVTLLSCCSVLAIINANAACAADQAAASSTAQAAPADANASPPMGEIIVTAQKRSERLSDVPMSIAAATSDQLRSRGINATEDLQKLVPGFSFQKSNYGTPIFYIRGVGFSDTTLGVSPAVTVYVDQVPLPFSAMTRGAILDLERVEVLKGPQGTLFGQNSTGGAINYIAAKPTDYLAAGGTLTVGRFGQIDGEAYLSGPITSTLSARIAVRHERQGDWQRSYVNSDTIGAKDFTNGRLSIDWKPADGIRFELQANAWKDRSDSQQPQFISYTDANPPSNGGRPPVYPIATFPAAPHNDRAAAWDSGYDFRRNDAFQQVSLRGDIDLSPSVLLTSLTSYAHLRTHLPQDFDATSYPSDRTEMNGTIDSFSQELRLSGSIGGKIKWMVGGNYQNDKVNELFHFTAISNSGSGITFPNGALFAWNSFEIVNNQKIETKSGFTSLDYKLSDTLTLQGSLRYTRQDRSFSGCTKDDGSGQIAAAFSVLSSAATQSVQNIAPGQCITLSSNFLPLPIETGTLNQDNLSWRVSANWKPAAGTLLYANVTKGYKAGSFPTLPAAISTQYTPIGQESVLAYEAGAKTSLLDRKVLLDAAAFYYDYRQKQLLGYKNIAPFGPLPALVSIPKSRIMGAEATVTLLPVTGLRVSIGGTYLDTRIQSDPLNPTGAFGTTGTFVGQSFPFTPRWQGTMDAEYKFPVSSNAAAFLGGSVSGRTSTKGTLFNATGAAAALERQLIMPGYALVDLRAGLQAEDGSWRVEIWGRNVGNRFYSNNTIHSADYTFRFTGMPATYGVTFKYNFSGK